MPYSSHLYTIFPYSIFIAVIFVIIPYSYKMSKRKSAAYYTAWYTLYSDSGLYGWRDEMEDTATC